MQICEISYAQHGAVENMAIDATMLEFAGQQGKACWRLYGWSEPAITFGYSQSWAWIRKETGNFSGKCIRRMTGGGIVDHRNDFTYALAIPPKHDRYRDPATNLYQTLHRHIATVLVEMGIPSDLAPCKEKCAGSVPDGLSGICFQQPEPYDVVAISSGEKLAGAAMKRNQSGILIQGSLDKQQLAGISNEVFEREFGQTLAEWLNAVRTPLMNEALPVETLSRNRARFASREWNQKR